jgi:5-carboxymethyl-2-hydroxymuconate isomerase
VPVIAMKAFDVTITETLQAVVTVEAESAEEAMRMVNDQWRAGDHILDAENFVNVDFEADAGRELEATQEQNSKTMEVLLVEPGQCPRIEAINRAINEKKRFLFGTMYVKSLNSNMAESLTSSAHMHWFGTVTTIMQ